MNPVNPVFAALLVPGADAAAGASLLALARDFSPRYEGHGAAVAIDVTGLGRLIGEPRAIGEALVREASARGWRAHVALARTWTAALVLAHARPGLTVVPPGDEAAALAPARIDLLQQITCRAALSGPSRHGPERPAPHVTRPPVSTFSHWGLRTLGELAALPDAELVARFGRPARAWQATARGEDGRPLVPALDEERFEASLELEWPIEGQEPLSFVLTRLLEPLSTRLERRDRGAAVLHVRLQLVTRASGAPPDVHARRLELPTPIRDVRTLRTLALLDLESHPPGAAIDAVTVFIEPTPARVLQHTLFARAQARPERMATLVARLHALMGQDRVGAPVAVDSYRPGAFAMTPFGAEPSSLCPEPSSLRPEPSPLSPEPSALSPPASRRSAFGAEAASLQPLASALRRFRIPVAARVVVEAGRPVRVTTDRRAIAGGVVLHASGPWRTSGEWWATGTDTPRASADARDPRANECRVTGAWGWDPTRSKKWHRDEWDVALADGACYRVFEDRDTGRWFIEAVID